MKDIGTIINLLLRKIGLKLIRFGNVRIPLKVYFR